MTWRQTPFTLGKTYLVKKEISSGFWKLSQGEKLIFVEESYSRVDSASIYYFQKEGSSERAEWWLYDDDPLSSYQEFFEEL